MKKGPHLCAFRSYREVLVGAVVSELSRSGSYDSKRGEFRALAVAFAIGFTLL